MKLKRCVALTLSMAMLSTPFNAYALTWGEIVNGLTSGGGKFVSGETKAEYKDDTLTVEGGEIDQMHVEIDGSKTGGKGVNIVLKNVELVNNSSVMVSDGAQGSLTLDKDSMADDLYGHAYDGSKLTIENQGNVNYLIRVDAEENSSANVINNGKVGESIWAYAGKSSTTTGVNNGETGYVDIWGYEGGQSTFINNGTIKDDGVWVDADDSGKATLQNNGTIVGDIAVDAEKDSAASLGNNGTIKNNVTMNAEKDSTVKMENNGTITGEQAPSVFVTTQSGANVSITGSGTVNPGKNGGTGATNDSLDIMVTLPDSVDLNDSEAVNKATLEAVAGVYIEGQIPGENKTLNVTIFGANGTEIKSDVVVEIKPVEEEPVDNGPSEEMIRHWMEVKRQEGAIGGVTGSPYVLRQVYIDYASRDMWVHDAAGEKLLFRESLSWSGTHTKRLTLNVRTDNTEGMNVRIGPDVVDLLRRLEFNEICINTEKGEPFMTYEVEMLYQTMKVFDIKPWELLVLGDADDQVMKITADLKMVPVEQQ